MIFQRIFAANCQPFTKMPGPNPIFPIGNLWDFLGKQDRPWEVIENYGTEYGKMSVFWMFNQPGIILNDAKLIEEVLCSRTQDFYKDEPCGALIPVLTRSSPNINNGDDWRRTRFSSPFTQPWIEGWRQNQMPHLVKFLRGWCQRMNTLTAATSVPLLNELQKCTFDCFSIATVGQQLSEVAYQDFMTLATEGSQRMLGIKKSKPELKSKGVATRQRFLRLLKDCYEKTASKPVDDAFDLLSLSLRNQVPLSPDELSAEMGNVYYGGCFSVPSTLVTMLYLLTQHPDELAKLIVAIRGINIDHDYDALLGCAPLDNALRETMRLLPSVPIFSRRVLPTDGTELGGQFLPQNTNLFISSWLLQRSTQYWEQPLVFNPDRWDNGVAEANPLGSDYFFPEGRGPRICLGAEYSMFFMKLVIATLLQTSRFECGAGQTYNAGQKFFFGVRMPAGLRGRFEPQNDR